MQHVKLRWLRIFNFSLIGVTVLLFVVYILFQQLNVSAATEAKWGITPTVLAIGFIHAVFVVISDRFFLKRYPWLTTLISMALYAFLNASIIESSGNTNVVYRITYGMLVFCMGLNGPFAPLTAVIFTWMLLIFTVTGIATPTNASLTFNIIVDICLTVAGFMGWYVFRRYYVPRDDKETKELVGTLEQEQLKSDVILESITDGVMIISPEGTVQSLNRSGATLLGWSRDEATNLDYRSLFSVEAEKGANEAQANQDAITQSANTNRPVQKVSLLKTHHGRNIYVDIVASPIQTATTPFEKTEEKKTVGVVAVLRDVDIQKRQEQQRSDFISTASHEMRTPVASIQGFIELALNEKVATIDPKAREYLQKAQEATRHLGDLFQDLLTVSKSDDGRLVSNPQLINVNEFLADEVEQNIIKAEKKQLKITTDAEALNGKSVKPLLYINADPDRLSEVISNLLENAIKYTEKGVITVGATLTDRGVVIRVSDTGAGIATEDIPHLFQKFYRTDNSVTREVGGTGLGLYISKQIVELMNGRIWVESALGTGSTFFVELPRVSPEQIAVLKQAQADKAQ
ncbi:PAS domain S-box protein [Candidatus Saccharibacteria bacterium]|nr:PAS domain S-box protein [Candidatus Saccharibacteria bacterium]